MSSTGLAPFDHTVQITNGWLRELTGQLGGYDDLHHAYHALRAVLHALRDRLGIEKAAALGAQMPMLVRGFYFEGWHPAGKPVKERTKHQFLSHVAAAYPAGPAPDPEAVVRQVFRLLSRHVSEGQIENIKATLPAEIRSLWS